MKSRRCSLITTSAWCALRMSHRHRKSRRSHKAGTFGLIAALAHQLKIARPVGAAARQRNDVIDFVSLGNVAIAAASAEAVLFDQQRGNIVSSVSTVDPHLTPPRFPRTHP